MLPPPADVLAFLAHRPEVTNARLTEYEVEAGDVWLYKIRCDLPNGYALQIRLREWGGDLSYSYQLFRTVPLLRCPNAPHHPALANFPHHFHDETDSKHPSLLTGDPLADLAIVLPQVIDYVAGH